MKTTLIGSMPQEETKIALDLIFENISIPCWPQLPKRSFLEQMHIQYSENFPGIKTDIKSQKIYLDKDCFYSKLEDYYEKFINKDLNYFSISKEHALGFYEFVNYIKNNKKQISQIKIQTIGPITFGLTIKDTNSQSIFYNEEIKIAIINHLIFKSLWQIKYIVENLNIEKIDIILFYDEPYLAAYGSAFSALYQQETIDTLNLLLSETKKQKDEIWQHKINLKIGIHCCANTDWSLLTSLDELDIISFDAYDFFENFSLYTQQIKNFVKNQKTIAWGVIPNTEKIFSETSDTIIEKLKNFIKILSKKSIDINLLTKNLIITPQCGLGNSTEEITKKVLDICKEINSISHEILL